MESGDGEQERGQDGQNPPNSIPPTKDYRVPFACHALARIDLPLTSGI
jgi:hypothetical protein